MENKTFKQVTLPDAEGVLQTYDIEIPTSQVTELDGILSIITDRLDALEYKEIKISSFGHNQGTKERGEIVTNPTLTWSLNKTPKSLKIDGEDITPLTATSKSYTGLSIKWDSGKTWTLTVTDTDPSGATVTKTATTSITFANWIYYGVLNSTTITEAQIEGLSGSVLSNSKSREVTYSAGAGEYLWYCLPDRLGACSFVDKGTGFAAALDDLGTIEVTNGSGYKENYRIYRSTFAGLGDLTIKIS